METILVTGSAGFVGFHVSRALLQAGKRVVGLDNFNTSYAPDLKKARTAILTEFPGFVFTGSGPG